MTSHHSISCDLNNLFNPAITDGPTSISQFESAFHAAHSGIIALKKTNQLPFSKLPEEDAVTQQVLDQAKRYHAVDNVIVLGIGGSALGTSSIYYALNGPYATSFLEKKKGAPRLFVIDNIEPDWMMDLVKLAEGQKNLFVLISKSGNTSETLAQYLFVKKHFNNVSHKDFFAITDPESGFLREFCTKHEIPNLPVPPGVGGRFSIFTPVGLFPLAVSGVNIREVLAGAAAMESRCQNSTLAQNPAGVLAMTLHHWMVQKNTSQVVMMPYSDRLRFVSDWFAQLWGESLGKRLTLNGEERFIGNTPIKAQGVTDQHSQLQLYLEGPRDKVVLFVEVENFASQGLLSDEKTGDERLDFLSGRSLRELLLAEKRGTEESLRENDRPNATIKLTEVNPYQLGQVYQLFMNVIPYMGALLNINPFDQPAVERIKKFTFGLMGHPKYSDFAMKMKDVVKKKEFVI